MTIGELMKSQRDALHLSLEDVATYVGVNRTTIMRWEKNAMDIDTKHIGKISTVLQIEPAIFCHPNEVIFPEERELIAAWRNADDAIRYSIRKLLGIEQKNDTQLLEKSHIL